MKIINSDFYFSSFHELYSKYPKLKDTLKNLKLEKELSFNFNRINDNCLGFIYKNALDSEEYKKFNLLKNTDLECFKKPNNFIFIDNKLYGYTINSYECSNLYNLSYHYSIKSIIKNLDEIDIDIENLSDNNILLLFINPEHILYNSYTKNIEFLHIQEFEIREDLKKDDILLMNYLLVHTVLLYSLFGRNIMDNLNNKKDIIYYFRNKILNEELEGEYSTKYFFDKVHATFEEVINDEVNTLGEFRSLAKTLKIKDE
ncbi:MAG: hypothetical protein IJD92_00195 [Bacilli bacterium]|nr:hypothetical protein [Bacilli bacterium]